MKDGSFSSAFLRFIRPVFEKIGPIRVRFVKSSFLRWGQCMGIVVKQIKNFAAVEGKQHFTDPARVVNPYAFFLRIFIFSADRPLPGRAAVCSDQ